MDLLNILQMFGIPSMIIALIAYVINATRAMKKGLQALLRSQLIGDYNHYVQKGFAPVYARENFENVYMQYHRLGANGVMDDLRERFLGLPTNSEEVINNE